MEDKDEKVTAMIKKNGKALIKHIIDSRDNKTFNHLIDIGCVNEKNISELMVYAYDSKKKTVKKVFLKFVMDDKDEKVTAMIKKSGKALMKHMIDAEDMAAIYHLLEIGCVTNKNIDELLDYAKVNEKHEPFITILNYKNK